MSTTPALAVAGGFNRHGVATLAVPPAVRDRHSIPDSHLEWMPTYCRAAPADFPAVFRYESICEASAAAGQVAHCCSKDGATNSEPPGLPLLGRDLRGFLDAELATHGAVVVRGLLAPNSTAQDFSDIMHATNYTLADYVGGVTLRPDYAPKVTPVSSEACSVSMESHNDDPYWEVPPTQLALFVQQPPAEGGQALVTDGRAVLRALEAAEPALLAELRRRRLRYVHFYQDAARLEGEGAVPTWQQAFVPTSCGGCNATRAAEAYLDAGGFGYEWTADGLRKWEVVDAVMAHPRTGEPMWMNQLTAMHCSVFDNHPAFSAYNRPPAARAEPCAMRGAMPYHTTYGDGGELPPRLIHAARRAQWAHTVSFDFEAGDLMVLDNYIAQHGRFSFTPPREILLTMITS